MRTSVRIDEEQECMIQQERWHENEESFYSLSSSLDMVPNLQFEELNDNDEQETRENENNLP